MNRSIFGLTLVLAILLGLPKTGTALQETVQNRSDRVIGSQLGEIVIERLARDLSLSSGQLEEVEHAASSYASAMGEAERTASERFKGWQREYWYERLPELRPDADISHLSYDERFEIGEQRGNLARGISPTLDDSFVAACSEAMNVSSQDVFQTQRRERERFLNSLSQILSDSQREKLPRAIRRLTINMADASDVDPLPVSDPVWQVDMIGLVEEASQPGCELERFALVCDGMSEPSVFDSDNERLLATMLIGLEESYADAISGFAEYTKEWLAKAAKREATSTDIAVRNAQKKVGDRLRRIWGIRFAYGDKISSFLHDTVGPEAAADFKKRCYARFCPVLFMPDSPDFVFQKIGLLDELDDKQREAAEVFYVDYRNDRHELRVRAVELEIEAMIPPRDDRMLQGIHVKRIERARAANEHLRSVLSISQQPLVDEWLGEFRKSIRYYRYKSHIRP